ncbi:hypothetical protein COCCADRAFT_40322 [Bipolaris zeicola 26-R-13]|uniref:Cytochrome P450 n=1 Tax=Cochliobolus carbonum (strain 26-R-13) TaxID=930089 RepID=W6Y2J9_COCC2|nr:uncharacterized protein COCCADRAFT_40322 [Bipolaris zeicola 26-R-13]EUC29264.1 hypothetical protein COCCADRAFT_40322 [Bipolaris zeicola 26-R-13]
MAVLSTLNQNTIIVSLLGIFLYFVGLVVYRLFFSPIANIPGPKLTAITFWVEAYWEVVKGGRFIFKIEEWHEKYGPIIRITPTEVHIRDAEFYNELFNTKSKYDKLPQMAHRLAHPQALVDSIEHDYHRRRRAAVAPFFTRQKIIDFSPYTSSRIKKMCNILETQYKGTGKVVCLNEAWGAYVADVLIWYICGLSYDFLDFPEFKSPFTTAIHNFLYSFPFATCFPTISKWLQGLPEWFLVMVDPKMKSVFEFRHEVKGQIRRIVAGENDADKHVTHRTVFHELLKSSMSRSELTQEMMEHEAQSFVGAGIDTTKTALTVGSFWILQTPGVKARLREELEKAMPNPDELLPLTKLEKLPYLNAVVQESLRMSYGLTNRLQRTNPMGVIQYDQYVIPPGTEFSMSNYLQVTDPKLFPNPDKFIPERWLDNPMTSTGHPLSKYLTNFGKGPRMCLGMNFSLAEMYLGLSGLFRLVDLELYETDRSDVDMAGSFFVPLPKASSKGIRVIVK